MKKLLILITAICLTTTSFSQTMLPGDTTLKANKIVHDQPDRVIMKDNKVWVIKNNEKSALAGDITLADGTMIKKDGTVKTPGGKTTAMKNGDCIYMNGKWQNNKTDKEMKKSTTD